MKGNEMVFEYICIYIVVCWCDFSDTGEGVKIHRKIC